MNPTVMKYLVMIALILSTTFYVDAAVSIEQLILIHEKYAFMNYRIFSGVTYSFANLLVNNK